MQGFCEYVKFKPCLPSTYISEPIKCDGEIVFATSEQPLANEHLNRNKVRHEAQT